MFPPTADRSFIGFDESKPGSGILFEHELFRELKRTFRDHAPELTEQGDQLFLSQAAQRRERADRRRPRQWPHRRTGRAPRRRHRSPRERPGRSPILPMPTESALALQQTSRRGRRQHGDALRRRFEQFRRIFVRARQQLRTWQQRMRLAGLAGGFDRTSLRSALRLMKHEVGRLRCASADACSAAAAGCGAETAS